MTTVYCIQYITVYTSVDLNTVIQYITVYTSVDLNTVIQYITVYTSVDLNTASYCILHHIYIAYCIIYILHIASYGTEGEFSVTNAILWSWEAGTVGQSQLHDTGIITKVLTRNKPPSPEFRL